MKDILIAITGMCIGFGGMTLIDQGVNTSVVGALFVAVISLLFLTIFIE